MELEKSTTLIIIIMVMGLFMINLSSAIQSETFIKDDLKTSELDTTTNYGTYIIEERTWWDIFGWWTEENIKEVTLKNNSDSCGENCYAIKEIKNLKESSLIDDVRFYRIYEDGSEKLSNIRSYEISYFGEIDDYQNICTLEKPITLENGTIYTPRECELTLVGSYDGWIPYELGKEMPIGNYTIKLTGQKRPSWSYDWQVLFGGTNVWSEEWATWGNITEGDDAEVTLNSPIDDYILLSNPQTFNCSANITGGSSLVNISLWTNESGTWEVKNTTDIILGTGDDLVGYWELDNDVLDELGIHNGTWSGAPAFAPGIINNGVDLEQSIGNYVILDDGSGSLDFTTENFSVSAWVKIESLDPAADLVVVGAGGAGGNNGWSLYIHERGIVQNITFGKVGTNEIASSLVVEVGVMSHIVMTYDQTANEVRFYLDGVADSLNPHSYSTNFNSGIPTNIGLHINDVFDGIIDEVGIWDRVLTSDNVIDLYNSGDGRRPGNETSPIQTWDRTITDTTLWTCQSCDSDGDCGFATENRTLLIDTTTTTIDIESPSGILGYNYIGGNETLNVTFTDVNLDSCWYNYNGTNITIDGCLTGILNSTNFTLEEGNINMIIYANDTLGNKNSTTISWEYNLTEISQTFPTTSVESATESYVLNSSYNSSKFSIITSTLTLNGTEYLATRTGSDDSAIFTSDAIMPSVESSTNFTPYWTVGLTDVSGITLYNVSVENVTVEIINLTLCDAGNNVAFWNFTIYNETNLVELNSTFEVTFSVKSIGSSEENSFSFSDTTGNNSQFDFCISPGSVNYTADANIKLTRTNYVDKFYNYQVVSISNSTREDILYMMLEDDSTSFIVHVVYVDSSNVNGAEVRVQRYYPGDGEWLTTEILTTNYIGEAVGHLLSEDADYRFLVFLNSVNIYTSSPTKITCAVAPCTVTLTIPIDVDTGIETPENLDSTLTYSGTTNIFTYTYSDTSDLFSSARLEVRRAFPSNATIIMPCDETKTTSSGVIICDITGQVNGTYRASGYITRDSDEFLDKRIAGSLGNTIYNQMSKDGILWSFFILISIIMLGITRPSMTIIFGIIGLIVIGLLGIINIGAISIIAISAIAVILLMRIGKE